MGGSIMDNTTLIITTIISLLTIIGFFSKFISMQTELKIELINIKKELLDINCKLDKRDEEIKKLTERIIKIESEVFKK
jgi:hypothetical protein